MRGTLSLKERIPTPGGTRPAGGATFFTSLQVAFTFKCSVPRAVPASATSKHTHQAGPERGNPTTVRRSSSSRRKANSRSGPVQIFFCQLQEEPIRFLRANPMRG